MHRKALSVCGRKSSTSCFKFSFSAKSCGSMQRRSVFVVASRVGRSAMKALLVSASGFSFNVAQVSRNPGKPLLFY